MFRFLKKILKIVFFAAIIVGIFSLGQYYGETQCKTCPPQDLDFSLFWEAYHAIKEKFANKDDIDEQEIIYGAISGMTESLDDDYTIFFNPEDTKIFMEDVKGTFTGVGMEIGIRDEILTVIAPLEGTPAQKAGFMPGDKIIKIDDVFTLGISTDEAVRLIRGPKDTEVTLTILRKNWEEPRELKVKRATIKVPSLKWEMISSSETDEDKNIAYLRIYHFSENATKDFKEAAVEILKSSAEKIILDLRSNPGGYLYVARDIAGWFLKTGDIVVTEDFNGEEPRKEYKSLGPEKLLSYPIVVLINRGTASGSEILAGALRDNRNIKLIGEVSFGKGSVQEVKYLSGGSSIKITIANWLTPNGTLITGQGLEPDIEVELTEQDYIEGRDPQLEKAIEVISKIR